jgi:hypothetical protein
MKKIMLILVVVLFVVSGASASVDRIYYSSGWQTETDILSETTYTSLAADPNTALLSFGAKAGGGIDRLYYSGGWQTETDIVSETYTALAADGVT